MSRLKRIFFFGTLLQKLQTPLLHLKIPLEDKRSSGAVALSAGAARTLLCAVGLTDAVVIRQS